VPFFSTVASHRSLKKVGQIQMRTCLVIFYQPILIIRQLKGEEEIGQTFLLLVG
jgi:hypothetical protein